jgi:hypothetical protein
VMVGEHIGLFQDLRASAGSQAVVRGTQRAGRLDASQIHFVPASDFQVASGVLYDMDASSGSFELEGNAGSVTFRWAEPVVVQQERGYGDWPALHGLVGKKVTVRYTEYRFRKTAHSVFWRTSRSVPATC